jgi:Pyruvate/2-oxoacid:ferredoxin oxidoreductase gamma subunit/NAD-dependent dihydropyrimidine dehydrogenase PreA subunit
MGDGGFWHNGLTSGIANAVFNRSDNLTIVVDNNYTSATGGQDLLSSKGGHASRSTGHAIERAVKGVGVEWVKTVTHTFDVSAMRAALRDALTTRATGPKVLVAQSECMLNRQRRERPLVKAAVARGERVVRERFGVDSDTCTGDHSCIRLSGCPSLSIKANPDPLRTDPVATVLDSCVGCGVCGEVSHAAVLCPSFYKARIVSNPSRPDRVHAAAARRGHRRAAAARRAPARPFRPSRLPPAMDAAPIKIAILAIGGEGGGVLADWIVDLAEHSGWLAQATSVPGVAQRTGATIYYVELFPAAAAGVAGAEPVLALMPMPGDVDIVLASELMEAARAVQRGLVTADRTTLIASTHRVWSITEKTALGDGRVSAAALVGHTRAAAARLVSFDMAEAAETPAASSAPSCSARLPAAARCRSAAPRSRTRSRAAASARSPADAPSMPASRARRRPLPRPPVPTRRASPTARRWRRPPPRPLHRIRQRRRQEQRRRRAIRRSPRWSAARAPAFRSRRRRSFSKECGRTIDWQDPAYAALYLERLAGLQAAAPRAEPRLIAESARPSRALDDLRRHDPRCGAEDARDALRARPGECAPIPASWSRSTSTCTRACRRSARRCPRRSAAGSSGRAGRAAWSSG